MWKWFSTLARLGVWLGIVALASATLIAYEGERSWLLGLAAHFRPHLAALSAAWLLFALVRHRPLAVVACAALLAVNAAPLAPYVAGGAQAASGGQGEPLRVMTFNMHGRGTDRSAFLEFVHTEQPHVIVLTELPPARDWLTQTLGAHYPYRLDAESDRPHGLLLLSRWPIIGSQVDRRVDRGQPVFAADLCAETARGGDDCVRLVGLHAVAPLGLRAAERQHAKFAVAAQMARAAPSGRVVLAGDLNMTPWSPRFHRLLQAAGLGDAAIGRGLTATWFSRQPIVGLMIDHVLASPEIATRDYLVGPDLGSDHLPVVADLMLPKRDLESVQ